MTAVLLWKEYRQQRAIWLAIAFLALLLVVSLGETLDHGNDWQVFRDEQLRDTLNLVVRCLIVSYGIVCGALLLAGESDDGTLAFLDTLTGWRNLLWTRKCLAGVLLTLSLSVVLSGLAVGLGFGSWETPLVLPLLGLDALVWGLLGGALCRKVLLAVLTGIWFMTVSWVLLVPWDNGVILLLGKTAAATAAGYTSWWNFCRSDRLRQRTAAQGSRPQKPRGRSAWRVLLWLVFRQGRWVVAAGLGGALLLGFTVHQEPLTYWPCGSLLLGLACGLAAFVPDQMAGSRFLGAQRLPPGRIWTVKILFWALVLLILTALAWIVEEMQGNTIRNDLLSSTANVREARTYNWRDSLEALGKLAVFLGVWPLYGFCFGQFFGLVMRRPVLAIILAAVFAPAAAAVWMPALIFGGLPLWQPLLIPAVLLLLTRLSQWPWMSERLWTVRPLATIVVGQVVMVLAVVSCLWYRVASAPDVGRPFDMSAFDTELRTFLHNEAGPLLQQAGGDLKIQQGKVEGQLWPQPRPAPRPPMPGGVPMAPNVPGAAAGPPAAAPFADWEMLSMEGRPSWVLDQVLCQGWPKENKELNRWLDGLFEGQWVQEAEKAAHLPLGLILDPRQNVIYSYQDYRTMAALFIERALQQQAHGDSRGALQHLETVLALSRQVKNCASASLLNDCVDFIEAYALSGFRVWLQNVGPDKELLRAAQVVLQRHEAETPDPANTIKVQYLIYRGNLAQDNQNNSLRRLAFQFPGEKERQIRIVNAIVAAELREIHKPLWQNSSEGKWLDKNADYDVLEAERLGLPPDSGPGSTLSARQWGELIWQFKMSGYRDTSTYSLTYPIQNIAAKSQRMQRATRLVVALARYQADHGKPPNQLDDLVPAYLDAVPNDSFTGKPFPYRISQGEQIKFHSRLLNSGAVCEPATLAPGQAIVGSETDFFFPVPVWSK